MRHLLGLLLSLTASAADIIIQPGTTVNPKAGDRMYLQTADGHIVPAMVVFRTDGNGNILPFDCSLMALNLPNSSKSLMYAMEMPKSMTLRMPLPNELKRVTK